MENQTPQQSSVENQPTEETLKKEKILTIGSSKNAQTQFKTALRNHIDLSAIADNKASIMLSVNALILTVGLPLLVVKIENNKTLLIPTIILTAVSLCSMVFATLATRPAKTAGKTSADDIINRRSNLFFFGNFHDMSIDEYEEGMLNVVASNEVLDNSIIRDLFFLGKALGRKFNYLRLCYNFFMYGIVLAVLSYVVVVLVS